MSYIGRGLETGSMRQLDDISSGFDGSDTTHTMQINSVDVDQSVVGDVNQLVLSLGGVIQKPGTDFTVSGSTLTFTTAPAANTSFFCVVIGGGGGFATPGDLTVTAGKLATDIAITTTGAANFNGGITMGGTTPSLTIGDAGAEDTKIVFDGNAQDFHIGLDDSADDLVIGVGSALGTTTAISITDGRAVTVGEAGIASSISGITFFQGDTGSIYTHDVSGTDNTAQYNTSYGLTALDAITDGDRNTAIGYGAGGALTTAFDCTLIGETAGTAITTGRSNIAIGKAAAVGFDTETHNLAIGAVALGGSVAGGEYNVAIGNYALDALTSADQAVAIGYGAGGALTTGASFVGVGYNAGVLVTTGNNIIAIGNQACDGFDTESNNIGIGSSALGGASLAGGEYNVAIGTDTLDALTSGDNNTALGYNAGSAKTSGSHCVFVGGSAGASVSTGASNVCVGVNSGQEGTVLTTGSNNILVGSAPCVSAADATYQFVIGDSVTSYGNSTTTIGYNTTEISTSHGSTSWAAQSDERYKKDIADTTAGLSFINDLRPVTFKWKLRNELDSNLYGYDADSTDAVGSNTLTQHGFIAQEVKTVLDNHSEVKDGQEIWKQADSTRSNRQYIAPTGLIPILTKAVQELSAKVKALEDA